MEAAAKHSHHARNGKSPCIVDTDINIEYTADELLKKFINAGQTCVAPDYLLVNKKLQNLVDSNEKCIHNFMYINQTLALDAMPELIKITLYRLVKFFTKRLLSVITQMICYIAPIVAAHVSLAARYKMKSWANSDCWIWDLSEYDRDERKTQTFSFIFIS